LNHKIRNALDRLPKREQPEAKELLRAIVYAPSHAVAKRSKRVENATALIWKLLTVAEMRFRKLNAPDQLRDLFEGRKYVDGKPVSTDQRKVPA
jgi:hypothetical protein